MQRYLLYYLYPFSSFSYLFCPSAESNSDISEALNLSAAEMAWIKKHPVVRVAPDPDFPPLEFID